MRILFLHPGDNPTRGPWTLEHWDLVVDLGTAGQNSYHIWSKFFGCTVITLEKPQSSDFREMRGMLARGLGSVVDDFGLDWYDLISTSYYEQVELAFALQRFIRPLPPTCEIAVSRPGFEAGAIARLLNLPVRTFSSSAGTGRVLHYLREFSRFSLRQLIQIAGDKYDAGYRWRKHFAKSPTRSSRPVVLLPTNYINVSRTELDYAALLPSSNFLLVSTRQSGITENLPPNVSLRKLASYAPGTFDSSEFDRLSLDFETMRVEMASRDALSALIYGEMARSFPAFLRDGLMVRNAWLRVLDLEPVSAVLCADDANHTTRIPLLLARERGLPAVSCHHGALDGRYRLRLKPDAFFLAKDRMERDYLSEVCGTDMGTVQVGGASANPASRIATANQSSIVFFSENYEAKGGRGEEFYRDVLPALSKLSEQTGRQLVVKLHPAEVAPTRKRMAKNVLSRDRFARLRFVQGPLTEELLANTWFAITVISTAAMDCTLRGIPTFLCAWLDYCNYGYAEQMIKFGAGYRLNHAAEIDDIPVRLESLDEPKIAGLKQPVSRDLLEDLLSGKLREVNQLATASAS